MILEILGHGLTAVEAFFDLGMGDVAAHDNGAVEREAGRNGVFGQFCEDFLHGTVEVNFHYFALAGLAVFFGDEFAGIGVEFLDPDAVAVDFGFNVAVGGAGNSEAYGA